MGLRVLHVLAYSLPNLSGYTIRSRYLLEFSKELGLEPFACTSAKYAHESPWQPKANYGGIDYFRTPEVSAGGSGLMREWRFFKAHQQRILEVATSEGAQAVHAHSPSLNGLASLKASRRLRIPLVYEMRALWEEAAKEAGKSAGGGWRFMLSRKMEEHLLDRCSAVVVISEHLKEELISRGLKKRIYVVPNGVDTERFTPRPTNEALKAELGLSGRCVIGYIGSFFRFEGLPVLLDAFEEVAQADGGKGAALLLVGGGEQEAEIRERVERTPVLSANVVMKKQIDHSLIADYYSVVDIFVYPRLMSRLTDLVTPLKPLEALAVGKAVLASDVGGLKELVADGRTGLLFKAEDPSALAQKLLQLINAPELRAALGEEARKEMLARRGWREVCKRYLGLYGDVMR